jgi:hypothetical protein
MAWYAPFVAFLTDPLYDLPLALTLATAAAVVIWSESHTAALPSLRPTRSRASWTERPESWAYGGLIEGRYFPAVQALGGRLAFALRTRYGVRLDHRRDLRRPEIDALLPSPLTLHRLADDMENAFQATLRAESPNWIERHWGWLQARRQRQSEALFHRIVRELQIALPILEAR